MITHMFYLHAQSQSLERHPSPIFSSKQLTHSSPKKDQTRSGVFLMFSHTNAGLPFVYSLLSYPLMMQETTSALLFLAPIEVSTSYIYYLLQIFSSQNVFAIVCLLGDLSLRLWDLHHGQQKIFEPRTFDRD